MVTRAVLKRACMECGDEYEPTKPWQKFCSVQCRDSARSRRNQELIELGRRAREVGMQ